MTVNYAAKYSAIVDERFKQGAKTAPAVNNNYEFNGVNSVTVYSMDTAPLNNYTMSGVSRYGTPAELGDTKQTLVLEQDKSFTFVIDARSNADTMGVHDAGAALRREIDEVIIPHIDAYRITKLVAGAKNSKTLAITKSNAYESFLAGTQKLAEELAPAVGRIAYVSPAFYNLIKQDASFVRAGDLSQNMLLSGQVGEIDGVAVILAPAIMAANVAFLITHKDACVSPVKLANYKVHDNPQGIDGKLVEGRIYFDAFVLNNKKGAVYVHKTAADA